MVKAEEHASGEETPKVNLSDVKNSDIEKAIEDWIHSKRDRLVLKLRLIDGLTYIKISDYLYEHENITLSERQIKNVVSKAEAKLFKHL